MSFEFKKCLVDETEVEGLWEINPKIFGDTRGNFLETYNEKDFNAAGLTMKFVQDNQSMSTKGVLRGMHFQKLHPQGKLIRVLIGKIYDVAIDLRNDSRTFGKYYGLIIDSKKQNMFYIPEGFAHGYYVLSENATVFYKTTDFYHPEDEDGIIWNDEKININWNIDMNPILSIKDRCLPSFNINNNYYNIYGVWKHKESLIIEKNCIKG